MLGLDAVLVMFLYVLLLYDVCSSLHQQPTKEQEQDGESGYRRKSRKDPDGKMHYWKTLPTGAKKRLPPSINIDVLWKKIRDAQKNLALTGVNHEQITDAMVDARRRDKVNAYLDQ